MERKKFLQYLCFSPIFLVLPKNILLYFANKGYNDKKCRKAWKSLCGKSDFEKPFQYIRPHNNRPKVFIYGDSISIGYTETVRIKLEGKADVFRLFKNGEASENFIPNMERMREIMFQPALERGWNFEWDLIHFNVGLHDLKYVFDGKYDKTKARKRASISQYKDNLHNICKYLLKIYPKAKLVFATTTPVPEGDPERDAGDEVAYNNAALEVLAGYPKIRINDLCALTKPNFDNWAIRSNNVHYNNIGKMEQGIAVARIVWDVLNIKKTSDN